MFELQVRNRAGTLPQRSHERALARTVRTDERDETATAARAPAYTGAAHQIPSQIAGLSAKRGAEQGPAHARAPFHVCVAGGHPCGHRVERLAHAELVEVLIEIPAIERRLQKRPDLLERRRAQLAFPKEVVEDEMHQLVLRRQVKQAVRLDPPRQHAARVHVDDAVLRGLPVDVETQQPSLLIAQHHHLECAGTRARYESALLKQVAALMDPRLVDEQIEIAAVEPAAWPGSQQRVRDPGRSQMSQDLDCRCLRIGKGAVGYHDLRASATCMPPTRRKRREFIGYFVVLRHHGIHRAAFCLRIADLFRIRGFAAPAHSVGGMPKRMA